NNSLIVMYLQQYGTSQIYTMPSSGRWGNTWYDYTFGGNTASFTQKIYVKLKSTDHNDLTEYQYAGFRGNRFRYVIVPVGLAASMNQTELIEFLSKKP
ncbi:MAG: hypothetical protein MI922_30385, partial [Bacteroidales bacterium]|nr:hypothetical protein [Bacteroidales bacterium]